MDRETNILDEQPEKGPKKLSNKVQHNKRWAGIGFLSLSVAEVVCCINMPFLFVPVGIFAFTNCVTGIAFFVPYFDRDQQETQNKFRGVLNFFCIIRSVA